MRLINVFSFGKSASAQVQFFGVLLLLTICFAQAQTVATPPLAADSSPTAPIAAPSGIKWNDLSPQKKASLAPLQNSWPLLSEAHQRKWLLLARNFPNMTPAEQEKLHSRMVDWAALKPRERELARLNFAETKKVPPHERAANWEAYQALSDDDRKQLAAKASAKKAKGGARSIKPANNKQTVVPLTRNTPDSLRALMQMQPAVSPLTLLPMRPATAAPLQSP